MNLAKGRKTCKSKGQKNIRREIKRSPYSPYSFFRVFAGTRVRTCSEAPSRRASFTPSFHSCSFSWTDINSSLFNEAGLKYALRTASDLACFKHVIVILILIHPSTTVIVKLTLNVTQIAKILVRCNIPQENRLLQRTSLNPKLRAFVSRMDLRKQTSLEPDSKVNSWRSSCQRIETGAIFRICLFDETGIKLKSQSITRVIDVTDPDVSGLLSPGGTKSLLLPRR